MHATARFLALAALCLALGAAQARGARHLAAAAAPAAAPGANSSACPPYGFDALEDFNVTDYISAPWYVLAQVRGGNDACEGEATCTLGTRPIPRRPTWLDPPAFGACACRCH